MKTKKRISEQEYQVAIELIKAYRKQLAQECQEISVLYYTLTPDTPLTDTDSSIFLLNAIQHGLQSDYGDILKKTGIDISKITLGEIATYFNMRMLLLCKNIGRKRITELGELLQTAGLKLKR